MVRFKVIKGSHLLLVFAVLVLAAVLAFLFVQNSAQPVLHPASSVEVVRYTQPEAKAISAFASDSLDDLKIEIIPDLPKTNESTAPYILIYHTHTHEAYQQDQNDPYEALEAWRTADTQHSVVRLGALLAEDLRQRGYRVTHDTTDHELDSINNSYVRSLETLEGYKEEPDLCIDLHRDAYSEGLLPCLTAQDGSQYAQMMILVGRGDNYSSNLKPDYAKNLAFAQELTLEINKQVENICRNVTVKQGRYNQHIGDHSILVEVGHNRNTLAQAMASIPHLAAGIDALLRQNH